MIFEEFKRIIVEAHYKEDLSFESLLDKCGFKKDSLVRYIKNYIDYNLEHIKDYEHLVLVIPIFLEGIIKCDLLDEQYEYLHNLYGEFQYRAKKSHRVTENKKTLKALRTSQGLIKTFIGDHKTDEEAYKKYEIKKFEYIWNILTDIRDPEFYRILIRRQCYFVNITDASFKSIFYRIAREYLNTYDEYYLRVLTIILESPDFLSEKEEIEHLYSLIEDGYRQKDAQRNMLDRLKKLLDHYFTNFEGARTFRNGISMIEEEPKKSPRSYPIILDRVDTMDRVDLTKLDTFTLTASRQNMSMIRIFNSTSAYSVMETDDGYELYYHIPDLPEYIGRDSAEEYRASHLIEEVTYKNCSAPLFDRDFLKTTTNFLVGYERLAMTFRIRLDKKFRMTSLEVFSSTIVNDRIYAGSEVGETLKSGDSKELALLSRISDALKDDSAWYKSKATEINEVLFDFLNRSVISLQNGSLPFIYKNLIGKDNMENVMKYSRLTEYTHRMWRSREAKQFLTIYKGQPLSVTLYSPAALSDSLSGTSLARVTDPHVSYVALENLRMVKDLVIRREGDRALWRERALHNSFIINSANRELYSEESEVKRLLINKKKCDRI